LTRITGFFSVVVELNYCNNSKKKKENGGQIETREKKERREEREEKEREGTKERRNI
jgi:poly-gamma-glutamate capsule biosynthesis protein CapA/YwtB (metallophosphatase superfamily)